MKEKILYRIPDKRKINFFRKKITYWFEKNAREYPWRETVDPYRFLAAEIMLRRTRADQVKDVILAAPQA